MRMIEGCGRVLVLLLVCCGAALGQGGDLLGALAEPRDYVQKRASSYDRTGGNDDFRVLPPGETLTVLDDAGPGVITHIWFTLASDETYHLKKLVLRMYWDGEATPSVDLYPSSKVKSAARLGKLSGSDRPLRKSPSEITSQPCVER